MDANLCKQYAERLRSILADYDAPTIKGAVLAWIRDATARELGIPRDTPEALAFRRSLLSPLLYSVFGERFLSEHAANNPGLLQTFGDNTLTRLEVFASEAGKLAGEHLHQIATITTKQLN